MEENVIQINGGTTINVSVSVKSIIYAKKIICYPATCSCQNGKNLASIMNDSVITCEEIKTIPTNSNEKNVTCKAQTFCILLVFLLITVALLIAVSIYCYLIKCQEKQKYLLHILRHKI